MKFPRRRMMTMMAPPELPEGSLGLQDPSRHHEVKQMAPAPTAPLADGTVPSGTIPAAGAPAFLPYGANATPEQKDLWARLAYAGKVREIGTEARDLTDSLVRVTQAIAVVDPSVRKQAVAKQLAELPPTGRRS